MIYSYKDMESVTTRIEEGEFVEVTFQFKDQVSISHKLAPNSSEILKSVFAWPLYGGKYEETGFNIKAVAASEV